HDPKRHPRIALLRKRRNNRVQRAVPSREGVWRGRIQGEKPPAVVESKSRSRSHDARSEQFVVTLNERHHVSFAIDNREIRRVVPCRCFSGCSFTVRRSEEHTSELQSPYDLVCRLLLEKKKQNKTKFIS